MIKVSNIADKIQLSLVRSLFNEAKLYDDVIDFTLGDPDIRPHQDIIDAACLAMNEGKSRYSQNAGLYELREVVCGKYAEEYGIAYDPAKEIIVTVGAMEGLYLAFLALLNPGDEVIIPEPYYINYRQMVTMCHAVPVLVGSDEKTMSVSVDNIARAVTPQTRAIVINSPSNPTGKLLTREQLEGIAAIAKENGLVVVTDEVYKSLVFDGKPYESIISIDGMKERTVLVNSLSKEFCMTGYRVGYVAAPEEIVSAMTKFQENIAACAPVPSQHAAMAAISGGAQYSSQMQKTFASRRKVLVEGLSAIPRIKVNVPEATFYAMVDISDTGMDCVEFCYALLRKAQVAVVPGITYGESCRNFIRLAFTMDEEKIREGIKRIADFVGTLN